MSESQVETSPYSSRYYVLYDTTAPQPTDIIGWVDIEDISTTEGLPAESDMIPVTPEQWADPAFHAPHGKGVLNGTIVDYTAPISLGVSAAEELSWIQEQATLATAMGQVFTEDMKKYVKSVQSIVTGTDTTSTLLPMRPTDIAA